MEQYAKEFVESYEKLREKHDLPKFDDLDYEFQLIDVISQRKYSPRYPLRFVRQVVETELKMRSKKRGT